MRPWAHWGWFTLTVINVRFGEAKARCVRSGFRGPALRGFLTLT